jgi:hypothetical protein
MAKPMTKLSSIVIDHNFVIQNIFFLPFAADQTGTYVSIKNAFTPH